MNLTERRKIATHYYQKGKSLINTSKEIQPDYGFDILLYIGIELILKSYLVIKDQNISKQTLIKYGHDLDKLRRDASKYDDLGIISSNNFEDMINWLLEFYSKDIVELRYNDTNKLRIFPAMTYDVLSSKLTEPVGYLLRDFRK